MQGIILVMMMLLTVVLMVIMVIILEVIMITSYKIVTVINTCMTVFPESNDSYVTDTDEESENDNEANVPKLAGWAANNNECARSGLNDLLDILRKQGHRLPRDSRTLLQTPRSIHTIKKCGGDYLYL
jgi:hypothetical protein